MGGPADPGSRVRIAVDAETWEPAAERDKALGRRPVSGIVRLGSPPLPISPGDLAEFPVRLRPPVPFRNFGADEKERYLGRLGIAASGSVTVPSAVRVTHRPSPAAASPVAEWRTRIEKIIARSFPTAEGSVLSALVIGEERAIPQGRGTIFSQPASRTFSPCPARTWASSPSSAARRPCCSSASSLRG